MDRCTLWDSECIGPLCFFSFLHVFSLVFFSTISSSLPSIASTRQIVYTSARPRYSFFVLFFFSDRRVLFALVSSSSLLMYKSPFSLFPTWRCMCAYSVVLLHKQKKKEREMRIDILFFILLLAYIHLHTHYNKFRLISNLFFFYRSKFHLILTIIKWLIQYVNSLLKINKLFIFFIEAFNNNNSITNRSYSSYNWTWT